MFQPSMSGAWRVLQNAIGPLKTHGPRALCQSSPVHSSACGNAQHVECVVMGAGDVGLAIARALALAGREVVILDSNSSFGSETSSRNSEVIHAGLYYPLGSLKSTMCVEGNQALYDFCQQRAIPFKNTGKLVVASTKEQVPSLRALHSRAQQCGARGLQLLSREEAVSLEPSVDCEEALLSPSSGILDSHTYMATLLADAESSGAVMAVASKVLRGKVLGDSRQVFMGTGNLPSATPADASSHADTLDATSNDASSDRNREVPSGSGSTRAPARATNTPVSTVAASRGGHQRGRTEGGGGGIVLEVEDMQSRERMELHADMVVNSAGLHAQSLSHSIDGIPSASIPPLYLAKGNYFTLAGGSISHSAREANSIDDTPSSRHQGPRPSFSRLIYPMPPAGGGGLGIHLTLDMGGGLRFGPDVEHVTDIDYTVSREEACVIVQMSKWEEACILDQM